MTEAEKSRVAAIVDRQKFIIARWATPKLRKALGTLAKNTETGYNEGGLERALVVVDEFLPEIQEVLLEIYNRTGEVFGEGTLRFIEGNLGLTIPSNDAVEDTMERITSRFSSVAVAESKLINQTNKKLIREKVAKLIESGMDEQRIGAELRKYQDNLSPARASMIARTEVHMIAEETQAEIVEDMDLPPMIKEWNASMDRRTRRDHRRVHGQRRKPNEPFDVGGEKMKYPGDRSAPPEQIINCRCTSMVLPEDDPGEVIEFDPDAAPETPGGFEGPGDFGAEA